MKRLAVPIGVGLALLCLLLLLSLYLLGFLSAPASSAPGPDVPELTLDEGLLALLGSENADVKQSLGGECYAEMTPRERARITYFSPYLSLQFALAREGEEVWLTGGADGVYAENPFADGLRVREIELCDEIEPDTPSLEAQPSLRQLFQCSEPLTYDFLCAALGQTPELRYIDRAFFDGDFVSAGSEPDSSGRGRQVGQQITGGQDRAEFKVDGIRLTVDFLRTEDALLAFHAIVRKA